MRIVVVIWCKYS